MANKKRILLIEDDPLIIRMYQNKLSTDGYNVETAFNGEEGLTKIRKQKPDAILLDIMMPEMNGVEVLKNLKSNDDTKDIPVIILTNLGDSQDDVEKSKEMGAFNYLVKSDISLAELSEEVKKALS